MVLNRNPKNYFAEVEQIAFCPSNMVPGIEASPDKMLQVCEAEKERGEGGGKGRGGRDGRKEGGEREGGEGREGKGRKKGMEGGGGSKVYMYMYHISSIRCHGYFFFLPFILVQLLFKGGILGKPEISTHGRYNEA